MYQTKYHLFAAVPKHHPSSPSVNFPQLIFWEAAGNKDLDRKWTGVHPAKRPDGSKRQKTTKTTPLLDLILPGLFNLKGVCYKRGKTPRFLKFWCFGTVVSSVLDVPSSTSSHISHQRLCESRYQTWIGIPPLVFFEGIAGMSCSSLGSLRINT